MIQSTLLALLLAGAAWSPRFADRLVLSALSAAVAALLAAELIRRARRSAGHVRPFGLAPSWAIPAVLTGLFILAQALNPSHGLGPDHDLIVRPHVAWLPRSVCRPATLLALWRLALGIAVFWAAHLAVSTPRRFRLFASILCLNGAAMAAWVVLDRVTPRPFEVFPTTGGFVNENSYAAYANLLLPVSLALAGSFRERALQRGSGSHPGLCLLAAAAALLASMLLIRSRAGLAICLGILGAWTIRTVASGVRSRRLALAAGTALAAAALGAAWILLREMPAGRDWTRLLTGEEVGFRLGVCKATLRMWSDRWFSGTGAGTFSLAFPYYQPRDVGGFFRHAHNDWLETLAELGIAGAALLAALAAGMLRRSRGAPADAGSPHARRGAEPALSGAESFALALALAGVALHAVVDFPMAITPIAVTVAAFMALLSRRPAGWRTIAGVGAPP